MNIIVRQNLMTEKGYTPYCGSPDCKIMPRTFFNGTQFECRCCGWKSSFPKAFIDEYVNHWNNSEVEK